MPQDHWLPGFNFNVEEWDAKGHNYEALANYRTLALAREAVGEVRRCRGRRHRPIEAIIAVNNITNLPWALLHYLREAAMRLVACLTVCLISIVANAAQTDTQAQPKQNASQSRHGNPID
jgi:hypothetical protein